jgi:hypothetical protein
MGEGKIHRDALNQIQEELESPPFNLRCKREVDLIRRGFRRIDLICINPALDSLANDYEITPIVALEMETNHNFNSPQIQSNSMDLKEISRLYPQSKTFHFHVSEVPDFKKELIRKKSNCKKDLENNCIIEKPNDKNNKTEKKIVRLVLPKGRLAFGW